MSFFERLKARLSSSPSNPSRRQFFRRAGGLGAGMALGGGLLMPDEAWAGVQDRAAAFGIEPGTVVDAQGRPMRPNRNGTTPFIGEIMMVGFNFAPVGWSLCAGQLLDIADNTALFSLLGTTFGGDGRFTFGLPDLRGRFPIGQGAGPGLSPISWGDKQGQETVALTAAQLPPHTHDLRASSEVGTTDAPSGAFPARPASSIPQYGTSTNATMAATASSGEGLSHSNMPPYLGLHFCISRTGSFPSRP